VRVKKSESDEQGTRARKRKRREESSEGVENMRTKEGRKEN